MRSNERRAGTERPDYAPQPQAETAVRIAALRKVLGSDVDEIAATLVDEDEAAYPGTWAAIGFDRGAAISEYLYEIEATERKES